MKDNRGKIKVLKTPEEIPEFASEEEEAEFWQTHSPVEIFDKLPKPKGVKFAPSKKHMVPLALDAGVYEEVRRAARKKGLSAPELIQQLQQWVERRVRTAHRAAKTKG